MLTSGLQEVQVRLEEQMLQRGAERYYKNRERLIASGDGASHNPHQRLIEDALPRVSKSIAKWIENHRNNVSRGKRPTSLAIIEAVNPDLLSAIGLMTCFNTLRGGDVRKSCWYIGQGVELEVWSADFQEREPKLFSRLVSRAKRKHSRRDLRVKSTKVIAAKAGFDGIEWTSDFRIKVGEPILNAILEASGVFAIETNEEGVSVVALTEEAHAAIQITDNIQCWMQPAAFPMVVPPRQWTRSNNGGYLNPELTEGVSKFRLIRTFDNSAQRLLDQHIKSGEAQPFLDGINAIQATPFSVNTRVAEMVQWSFDEGLSVKKLPKRDPLPKVVFPDDYEELDWKQQKGWRLKAGEVATINRGIISEAAGFKQDMWMANMLSEYPAFYLPHNVDFRGRLYAIPHFNHQRADYIRAMIQFADGKPIGDGGDWLMIHLANTGDFEKVSKKSFADRLLWVQKNHDAILSVARDPKRATWWISADAPFQFLAACFEYEGWCRDGAAFVSRLPISLDGSNSGLQHYSAALRAYEDGKHVNLVPQEKPADVYQAVADVVAAEVEGERGDELADLWLAYGITRTVVKRCVMTFAYSSETFGFKNHIIEDLMTPLHHQVLLGELAEHPFKDKSFAAAGYIAKKIFAAVNEVVSKAGEGMKFLQKVAQVLAHESKPMIWTTPVGFPVIHRYSDWDIKRIELFLYDRSLAVGDEHSKDRVTEDGGVLRRIIANARTNRRPTIDKAKQKSAVAPNVIHSNDAAHLLLTVRAAKAEGIDAFCLIHDSFATHAADTGRFSQIIRDQLVEMYENNDPFQTIYEAACASLSDKGREKLPLPPAKGTLDLTLVRSSLYSFA
jgi:DNA-directed RNA polymerase